MKILAILGSPHKGNTYKLLQQVEENMKKCGEVEFEYLLIKDGNLEMCRGCFLCVSKGEESCPIKDDVLKIKEKMLSADGVIFASPGYVQNVSALMKNFIDRMSHICHRPCFFGKHAMAVVTSCGGGIPETLKYLDSIIRVWGFNSVEKLGVMVHPAVKKTDKTVMKIENSAKKFYNTIQEKKQYPPRLYDLLQFRIMKFNCMESKEHFASDYEFYKDKKDYYINTPINALKNMLAKILEKVIIYSMGKAS